MKKIVLLPVRNEDWILRQSLHNFSSFADHIIVADQMSTDNSREIYKEFDKVIVIDNPNTGHSNTVRWLLLDKARELFGNNNLIFCIDADEMISLQCAQEIETIVSEKINVSPNNTPSFELPWIQLWKSINKHRVDSVWANNYKAIAFLDNGTIDYQREFTLNDHTARVPTTSELIRLSHPLLHLQFVAWDQTQIKQAWYRCSELIAKKRSPQAINYAYSVSMDGVHVALEDTPPVWIEQIPEAKDVRPPQDQQSSWHFQEVTKWFDQYRVEFFEPLEIWQIPEFRAIFVQKMNRDPHPRTYPKALIIANKIKNFIKKLLQPSK